MFVPFGKGIAAIKTLLVCRHAKSSWGDATLPDHERPLNKRGLRDAPRSAARLKIRATKIDRIVSSSALRALSTARIIAQAYDPALEVTVDERLYGADEYEWLRIVRGLNDSLDTVMMVGHNPGLTDFVNRLLPEPVENIPTCGMVELVLYIRRWRDVGPGQTVRTSMDCPKKHAE